MTKNPNAVALGSIRSAEKAAASVANGKLGGKRSPAMHCLTVLMAAKDGSWDQDLRDRAYEVWLEVATPSHVRKHWRKWMGPRPW